MLFKARKNFLANQTFTLGSTVTFNISREFWLERLYIILDITASGAIATATADGLLGILKRVTLNVSDGASSRDVVSCSGRALIEYAAMVASNLDRGTLDALDATSATTYRIVYPIYCVQPQIQDPIGSAMLLPLSRYNQDPVLRLEFAAQADIDSHATPTFAISAGTVQIVTVKRVVDIANWVAYDWQLQELEQSYASTGNGQSFTLPSPGSYTGIALRCYTTAAARGDIMVANGEFRLELLGNVLWRNRLLNVQAENDFSTSFITTTADRFAGLYYLDFLTDRYGDVNDLGSVLDANVTAGSGADLKLLQDITGGAAVKVKYLMHRIFGDLSGLKINKK